MRLSQSVKKISQKLIYKKLQAMTFLYLLKGKRIMIRVETRFLNDIDEKEEVKFLLNQKIC